MEFETESSFKIMKIHANISELNLYFPFEVAIRNDQK